MEIVKTPDFKFKFKQRGRPNKYPFNELKPGLSLKIPIKNDKDIKRITSALYQYKKGNSLDWVTFTRVENNIIYINRVK